MKNPALIFLNICFNLLRFFTEPYNETKPLNCNKNSVNEHKIL